jgi:hypothetical protein
MSRRAPDKRSNDVFGPRLEEFPLLPDIAAKAGWCLLGIGALLLWCLALATADRLLLRPLADKKISPVLLGGYAREMREAGR